MKKRFLILAVMMLSLLGIKIPTAAQTPIVNVGEGAILSVSEGSIVRINGSYSAATGAKTYINGNVEITGSWTNNGTQASNKGQVVFLGAQSASILGTGSTGFYRIVLNKDTRDTVLELATSLSDTSSFLVLQTGTFRVSGNYAWLNPFFVLNTNKINIPATAVFSLENANVAVTGQAADVSLYGILKVTNGIFNVGTLATEGTAGTPSSIRYYGTSTDTAQTQMIISGGTVNVTKNIVANTGTNILRYVQTGGDVNIATGGMQSFYGFYLPSGSIFRGEGGTIALKNSSTTSNDVEISTGVIADTVNSVHTLLKIDPQSVGQNFKINSSAALGGLNVVGTNSPVVNQYSELTINDSVTIAGTGTDRYLFNNQKLNLYGNLNINLAANNGINQGSSIIYFLGNRGQHITSTTLSDLQLANININKTGQNVTLDKNLSIASGAALRLYGQKSILDMSSNNLTIPSDAKIYFQQNGTTSEGIIGFGDTTFITSSTTDSLNGGRLIKKIAAGTISTASVINFPVGYTRIKSNAGGGFDTTNVYTPAQIEIDAATAAADADLSIKVIPSQHPAVEDTGRTTVLYWNLASSNLNLNGFGAKINSMQYRNSVINGNEGVYKVLFFSPAWNGTDNSAGKWYINPGNTNNIVNFNANSFESNLINKLDGDWLAGEQSAAKAIYYSRANGNYNDPATWSKNTFGGTASTTAPTKGSDIVRILGNTVTVTENTPLVGKLSVESATTDRTAGILLFEGENFVSGDTFNLMAGATIGVSSADGITASAAKGNIQTNIRNFGVSNYEYIGDATQVTGDGLPNTISAIIISKADETIVSLDRSIQVADSLYVISGIFNLASNTINGNTPGKLMRMDGGELRVPAAFPLNYTSPKFTAGTINFTGTGNSTIPSSTTNPAVAQYNNLKIQSLTGETRDGNITLPSTGEIAIYDNFDISELSFSNGTRSFITDGSTVRFLKNDAASTQYIRSIPASSYYAGKLRYYNLTIDSAGTKQLGLNPGQGDTLVVLNNLTISNGSTLYSNGNNLDVFGNWINNGGTFTGGTNRVRCISEVAMQTTNIDLTPAAGKTVSNDFYDIEFNGPGIINAITVTNPIVVSHNLQIDTTTTLKGNANTILISGDWRALGGKFDYGTSTVQFVGNAQPQTIYRTSGSGTFYNLTINNTNTATEPINTVSVSLPNGDTTGIIVNNVLSLNSSILKSHVGTAFRYVKVFGDVTRNNVANGGFVDGQLRKNIATGAVANRSFEVGYNKIYTPVTINTTGTDGTAGFIGILSDTLNNATAPVSLSTTSISPAGSQISPGNLIKRQYRVSVPARSTFALGTRTYNLSVNFGETITNYPIYKAALLKPNNTDWVTPLSYSDGETPVITSGSATGLTYANLKDFGTAIFGAPDTLTFYSRLVAGNWSDPNSWSHQKYGGTAAPDYPGRDAGVIYKVFVGYSNSGTDTIRHTITLDQNIATIENCKIYVDTLGTLMTGNNIISGAGSFTMLSGATLGVGSAAGITATAAAGNIQTSVRQFNGTDGNNHNNSSFIYNGSGAQTSGDGIPANVARLTVNKADASTMTMNSSKIGVHDSLWVKAGTMNLGTADLWLYRDMLVDTLGAFVHNNKTTYARGDTLILIGAKSATAGANREINFYALNIAKPLGKGHVTLDANTNLNITQNITFRNAPTAAEIAAGDSVANKALIDATTHSSSTNTLYVYVGGTVNNAGQVNDVLKGGWVYGELRKNVPTGTTDVTFESGTDNYYAPFNIHYYAATGGVAGVLGGRSIKGKEDHLLAGAPTVFPINESRYVDVHWRLTKPTGSTFNRGTRSADYTVYFKIPELATNLYCFDCADIAYYTGTGWQGLPATNKYGNAAWNTTDWASPDTCSDARKDQKFNGFPNFIYEGDSCSTNDVLGFVKVKDVTTTATAYNNNGTYGTVNVNYGTTVLNDGSGTMLADFVAGNRNEIIYYTFYSRQNGNWSDPNTWSTVSFTSDSNGARAYVNGSPSDSRITPIPTRKYDNVIIGGGHTVVLDVNVGANDNSPADYFGPSCKVQSDGTLDLGTCVFRGSQFTTEKGATLIIGSNDGISGSNKSNYTGNVQLSYYSTAPLFADSINVIYRPTGRTSNGMSRSGVNRNSSNNYITRTRIHDNTANADVLDYTSGNHYRASTYGLQRPLKSFTLTPGHTYQVYVTPNYQYYYNNNWTDSVYFAAWVDSSFTGIGWKQLSNNGIRNYGRYNGNEVSIGTFNGDACSSYQGSTTFRIGMSYDQNLADVRTIYIDTTTFSYAAITGDGEYEDYTVYIKKANYTANQVCGTGLPSKVSTLKLNRSTDATALSTLTLGRNVTVMDTCEIISGIMNQNRRDTLFLYGDFKVDTVGGYNPDKYYSSNYKYYKLFRPYSVFGGPVVFAGNKNNNISSAAGDTIYFNKLNIDKVGNAVVNANANIAVSKSLFVKTNNNLVMGTGKNLILGGYAKANSSSDSIFTIKNMVKVSGGAADGSNVVKDFLTYYPDRNDTKNFTYDSTNMNASDKYISKITIGSYQVKPTGANNNGYAASGYQDFTSSNYTGNYNINLQCGQTYNITFDMVSSTDSRNSAKSQPSNCYVYLDRYWDGFTEDEMIGKLEGVSGQIGSSNINQIVVPCTIPANLYNAKTRIRVKVANNTPRTDPNQRETYVTVSNNVPYRKPTGGEAEDYLVNVTGGIAVPDTTHDNNYFVVYDSTVSYDSSNVQTVSQNYTTFTSSSLGGYWTYNGTRLQTAFINNIYYNQINYPIDTWQAWAGGAYRYYTYKYQYRTGDTLVLTAGGNNIFRFDFSQYFTSTEYAVAWVDTDHLGKYKSDYDDNHVFGKTFGISDTATSFQMNVALPDSAYNGTTRMRLKLFNSAPGKNLYQPNLDAFYQCLDLPVRIIGGRDPYPYRNIAAYPINSTNVNSNTMYKMIASTVRTIDTAQVYKQTKNFAMPIGVDTSYNPIVFNLPNKTLDTTAGSPESWLSVKLVNGKHPNRLNDSCLDKYWTVAKRNLTVKELTSGTDSARIMYYYNPANITGDTSKYIPSCRRGSDWDIDLGYFPYAKSSPVKVTEEPDLVGDWTAGQPVVYYNYRYYYSRQSGTWNNPQNWSADMKLKHLGKRSAYYPGELYEDDIAFIDGHDITFSDSLHIIIDSLHMGGTNPIPAADAGTLTNNNTAQGRLLFANTAAALGTGNKQLEMRSLELASGDNGLITTAAGAANLKDTLIIKKILNNASTTGGLSLKNGTNTIYLKFDGSKYWTLDTSAHYIDSVKSAGDTLCVVKGEGAWGDLPDIFLAKTGGLDDTLHVNSNSFNLATAGAEDFKFHPDQGVITNETATNPLWLSSNNNLVSMGMNSGINVIQGTTSTAGTLETNTNTTLNVNGGTLNVGDSKNEHLLYKTGTVINLGDAVNTDGSYKIGTINTAGAFDRSGSNSTVDLTIGNGGLFKVNTVNNTEKIGFNIPNSTSKFTMTGGRIVIANAAGGETTQGSDFNVNAGTISGGTVQSGDSLLTPANTVIKIAGLTPLFKLHMANAAANNVTTDVDASVLTIQDSLTIDANHTANLQGNSIYLAGNLTNYGIFKALPSAATSSLWELRLNGTADQTLASTSALMLNNLTLDKQTGNVKLSSDSPFLTDVIIKNRFELTAENTSIIDAGGPTSNRYVEMSPLVVGTTTISTPQLFRNGLGHVWGHFRNYIADNTNATIFPIGGNTNLAYRPLTIAPQQSGNTAGMLDGYFTPSQHPAVNATSRPFLTDKLMQEYWTVNPISTSAFGLNAGNTFRLKVEFLQGDMPTGSTLSNLQQFIYNPPYANSGTAGAWYQTVTETDAEYYVISKTNTRFGDIALSELESIQFYSSGDGNWDNPSNWVTGSYEGTANGYNRAPSLTTDEAHIGNGKSITVSENLNVNIKNIVVETHKGLPGKLIIKGENGKVQAEKFSLGDSCTIETENIYGIEPAGQQSGAVQASGEATYGVSRYIYSGIAGSQQSGRGLPNKILTLILNNSSQNLNKGLFIYTDAEAQSINIQDTLLVKQGEFIPGSRGIKIRNCFILDSADDGNDGYLKPNDSKFTFSNPSTFLIVKNVRGAYFNDIVVDRNSNVLATAPKGDTIPATKNISINDNLTFTGDAGEYSYFTLGDSVSLSFTKAGTGLFTNAGTNKFVVTSKKSGYLNQIIGASTTAYTYPVGSKDDGAYRYGKVEFTASAGAGTGKTLGVSTNWGSKPDPMIYAHIGMKNNAALNYLRRYWSVGNVSDGLVGRLRLFYQDGDINVPANEAKLDRLAKYSKLKEDAQGHWNVYTYGTGPNDVSLNQTDNYVITKAGLTKAQLWGDWALGQNPIFRRIFFSLANGNWNSDQSWTFNSDYSAPIAGTGLYPGESGDSVVIGNNKEITMTENAFSAEQQSDVGVQLGTSTTDVGTLNMQGFQLFGSTFTMEAGSTLKIGHAAGINTVANGLSIGNILTTSLRSFSTGGNYVYNGTSNQVTGDALPATVNDLTVANTGTTLGDTVKFNRNQTLTGNFKVQSGKADIAANIFTATGAASTLEVDNDAYLRIGAGSTIMTPSASLVGFKNFTIGESSWFDFYAEAANETTAQNISLVPTGLFDKDNPTVGLGFGNVKLTKKGTATTYFNVTQHIKLRGNLYTDPETYLTVTESPDNNLEVLKSIHNSGTIYNKRLIEIGTGD